MDQKIFHGSVTPDDFAQSLLAEFNRGNYRVQKIGQNPKTVVQIATTERPSSGGQTAISVTITQVEDGVSIELGKQAWLGVAASLGQTALAAFRNPLSLLGRLDDLAQDIESLKLEEDIWKVIAEVARSTQSSQELSERLRRVECSFCGTANPVGQSNCIACGAPMGNVQPGTCKNCGFVITEGEKYCPNCGNLL
jgi:hypothetical protein